MKHLTTRNVLFVASGIIISLLTALIMITSNSNHKLTEQFVIDNSAVINVLGRTNKIITASDDTKQRLSDFSQTNDSIVGVQLVGVSPQLNQRKTLYLASKSQVLSKALANLGEPVGVFIEGNEFNNIRMIAMMNGEFWCYSSEKTLVTQIAPIVYPIAPVICSIAVPPNGRAFSGYFNMYLSRQPLIAEIEQYRAKLTALSAAIYAKDTK